MVAAGGLPAKSPSSSADKKSAELEAEDKAFAKGIYRHIAVLVSAQQLCHQKLGQYSATIAGSCAQSALLFENFLFWLCQTC